MFRLGLFLSFFARRLLLQLGRVVDRRGVAGVAVCSSEFEPAVAAWTALHGFDAAAAFVPHPVQPRSDEEMRAMAEAAVEGILAALGE